MQKYVRTCIDRIIDSTDSKNQIFLVKCAKTGTVSAKMHKKSQNALLAAQLKAKLINFSINTEIYKANFKRIESPFSKKHLNAKLEKWHQLHAIVFVIKFDAMLPTLELLSLSTGIGNWELGSGNWELGIGKGKWGGGNPGLDRVKKPKRTLYYLPT